MNVALISLGCPKNLVDSEKTLGHLAARGIVFCDNPEEADAVIINTCGFIEEAKQESIDVILEQIERKRRGLLQFVGVVGCLSERYKEDLREELPEVDFFAGIANPLDIERLANRLAPTRGGRRRARSYLSARYPRLRLTPDHVAYLRVAEGCNNRCSYCAIPIIRGPLVSRAVPDVRREASELVRHGARELVLIAQDTTNFGYDRTGRRELAGLVRELTKVDGLQWLRMLYWHPAHVTDELIEEVAANEKVVSYVDLPLQHINNRILRSMHRRVSRKRIEALIEKLRRRVPDVALRTSFIVGYPGETDEEFDELLGFVRQTEFDHVGAFAYSVEEGTRAARMEGRVDERVTKRRLGRLMKAQQRIVFRRNTSLVGKTFRVVFDKRSPDNKNVWVSRSWREAPDIDSVILTEAQRGRPGMFVEAEIVGSDGYDLLARARNGRK